MGPESWPDRWSGRSRTGIRRVEDDLREILSAGLEAADPRAAVLRFLGDDILPEQENVSDERVFVLSVGKAALAMAAEEYLGERIEGGLVVTKVGHEAPLEILETIVASHPEPDERSAEAARSSSSSWNRWGKETCSWPSFPVGSRRYSRTLSLPSNSRT